MGVVLDVEFVVVHTVLLSTINCTRGCCRGGEEADTDAAATGGGALLDVNRRVGCGWEKHERASEDDDDDGATDICGSWTPGADGRCDDAEEELI